MLFARATYPKKNRLLRRSDYLRLSSSSPFSRGRMFILLVQENGLALPRIGITVSRKVGNAVVRNRIKRHLREVFRHMCSVLPSVDLHVIARRSAAGCPSAVLREEFLTVLRRMG